MTSEPKRCGADVCGEVCGARVALPDALAQLVERRVQEGADVRLSQLQERIKIESAELTAFFRIFRTYTGCVSSHREPGLG